MDRTETIAILNELLGREQRSIAPRLFESTIFLTEASLPGFDWARRAARDQADNVAALSELIVELSGEPAPKQGNLATADLHFQELPALVPRLLHDLDGLVKVFRVALGRLAGEPKAATLVSRILAVHEAECASLQSIGAAAPTSAARAS